MAEVTIYSDFGAQENKVCQCLNCFPIYLPWRDRTDVMILVFWMLGFKPTFSLCSSLSSRGSLLKLVSIELVIPSNHLILCRPLFLLPSIFPSIRAFSNELALCIRWPMYWSFNFSISPSNEYSGLISFGMDWLDFLAVQGTLKSFLQYHCSKATILQCLAFFIVQFSLPCMTTTKTIALTTRTFVGKLMSLLF